MSSLTLADAVMQWLGNGPPVRVEHRRALVLGAGFTMSCWPDAPSFNAFRPLLAEELRRLPVYASALRPAVPADDAEATKDWVEVSALAELLDHHADRLKVAQTVLAEPVGSRHRLYPPMDPARRPLPPRMPSAFRPLERWIRDVMPQSPTHLDVLAPGGPCAVLGRLVGERVVSDIVSTNWDAYVELGCAMAGVRVCDGDEPTRARPSWLDQLPTRLHVYETAEEAALLPRPAASVLLFKIHGGVRTILGLLGAQHLGRMTGDEASEQLSRCFLVSTQDLVHWDEPVRWVREVVPDTLRSHAVLCIGVSGSDPVMYRAFRDRAREWEVAEARDHASAGKRSPGRILKRRTPPFVALGRSLDSARLANMVAVGKGVNLTHQLAKGDGSAALKALYAGWLGQHLIEAVSSRPGANAAIGARISAALRFEADLLGADGKTKPEQAPLTHLLAWSLGPGARWAGIAERRPPFEAGPHDRLRRWWASSWWGIPGWADPDRTHLAEIAAFSALIALGGSLEDIDPWSGVVRLAPGHPLAQKLGGRASLLPTPWPWAPSKGLGSATLRAELRDRFGWGPGRSLPALSGAKLWLAPAPLLPLPGIWTGPPSMQVGPARAEVLLHGRVKTWIEEANDVFP